MLVILALAPFSVRADQLCKPAEPLAQSKCTKDAQCCAGLVCQTGRCQAGCRIGSAFVPSGTKSGQCQSCQPSVSTTSWTNLANGSACSDGNLCTQSDSCQAGACVGANPVTCSAGGQCLLAGTCDPATGTCSSPTPLPNGTSCSDGNACTASDSCQSGACVGQPVTCPASACRDAGTCDPATGACSNAPKPDGTACNDGNACTRTDTCTAGVCVGSNAVTCTSSDQCHAAGTCDPSTGVCSNPAQPNGTSCSDGNACTSGDACVNGTCTGTVVADDTPCEDGIGCTRGSTCKAGACQIGTPWCVTTDLCVPYYCDFFSGGCLPAPVGCPALAADSCWSSICNSATGKCEDQLVSLSPLCGDECEADSDCGGTFPNSCIDGRCSNDGSACTASADCGVSHNACVTNSCAADESGLKHCYYTDVNCDDGDPCTQDTCEPLHGCGHYLADPAVLCDDGNPCTVESCGPSGCVHTPIDGCTNPN